MLGQRHEGAAAGGTVDADVTAQLPCPLPHRVQTPGCGVPPTAPVVADPQGQAIVSDDEVKLDGGRAGVSVRAGGGDPS